MNIRCIRFWLAWSIAIRAAAPVFAAQPLPPRTYSLVEVSRMTELGLFSPNAADLRLYRDGTREAVELSIPPAGASKGVRMRYLFDLEAHKAYTVNAMTRACSWMRYVSDDPPFNYDPIAGAASLAADMSKQPPKFIGTERVNGIPARVAEFRGVDGRVESRAWIAEPGGFLVKSEMVGGDGNAVTLLEVKKVDFAKRTDVSLDLPSSCDHQTAGEWSSTGLTARGISRRPVGMACASRGAQRQADAG